MYGYYFENIYIVVAPYCSLFKCHHATCRLILQTCEFSSLVKPNYHRGHCFKRTADFLYYPILTLLPTLTPESVALLPAK